MDQFVEAIRQHLPPPRLLPPKPQPQGALLPVRPAPESEPDESEPPLPLASIAAGRRDFDAAGACGAYEDAGALNTEGLSPCCAAVVSAGCDMAV